MLGLGIDLDVWPWVWLGIAVILALVELTVLGGNFILLPWAISGFAASMAGFAGVSLELQWLLFALGGAALFALFYKLARRFVTDNDLAPGVGAGRLLGAVGTVTRAIDPTDVERRGRISVQGEVWGALTVGQDPLPEGERVLVREVQGTRLVVERVDPSKPGGTQ